MSKDGLDRELLRKHLDYSKSLLDLFFESASDLMVLMDLNFRIMRGNRAAYRLARLNNHIHVSEDIVGKKCHFVFYGRKTECENCPISNSIQKKTNTSVEFYNPRYKRWYNYLVYPIFDGNKVVAMACVVRDLTAQKQYEESIERERRHLEMKYRNLIEWSNDGIMIIQDGRAVFHNKVATKILGYSSDEIKNLQIKDFIDGKEETKAIFKQYKDRLEKGAFPSLFNVRIKRKDATTVDVEMNAAMIEWDGRPAGLAIVRDISERKKMEEIRHKSMEKFQTLIERSNDAIIVIQDGNVVYNNKMAQDTFGYSLEDVQGRPFTDFIPDPNEAKSFYQRYLDRMSGKVLPSVVEAKIRGKKDQIIDVEISGGMIEWDGKPADLVIIRDISERKLTERKLKESEEKYRSIINRSNDAIIIVQDGYTVFNNSKTNEMFGYADEELRRTHLKSFFPEKKGIPALIKQYNDLIAGKEIPSLTELKIRRKDGSIIDVEYNTSLFEWNGKYAALVVVRDISERKFAEKTIKDFEERFRTILEAIPDLFFLVSGDSRILDFWGATEKTYAPPEEFLSMKMIDLLPNDLKATCLESIRKTLNTKEPQSLEYFLTIEGIQRYFKAQYLYFSEDRVGIFIRDLTIQRKIEEELTKTSELNQLILDNVDLPINISDLNGELLAYNKGSEKLFGWKSEEVIGKSIKIFHPKEDHQTLVPQIIKDALEKGKFEKAVRLVRKNGETLLANLVVTPIHDKNKKLIALLGIAKRI
ncbi:MAG: PAS domain S-box protein [Candidatus Helarchaeota archaeon]